MKLGGFHDISVCGFKPRLLFKGVDLCRCHALTNYLCFLLIFKSANYLYFCKPCSRGIIDSSGSSSIINRSSAKALNLRCCPLIERYFMFLFPLSCSRRSSKIRINKRGDRGHPHLVPIYIYICPKSGIDFH